MWSSKTDEHSNHCCAIISHLLFALRISCSYASAYEHQWASLTALPNGWCSTWLRFYLLTFLLFNFYFFFFCFSLAFVDIYWYVYIANIYIDIYVYLCALARRFCCLLFVAVVDDNAAVSSTKTLATRQCHRHRRRRRALEKCVVIFVCDLVTSTPSNVADVQSGAKTENTHRKYTK